MITNVEFKDYFDRDFSFSETLPDVRDKDIDKAIAEASEVYNESLYPNEEIKAQAQLYLTAHFLTLNLDSADSGGQSRFNENSKSVGSISISNQIPEWISNNNEFSIYATTAYGLKFLIISKPFLDGAVYSIPGATQY